MARTCRIKMYSIFLNIKYKFLLIYACYFITFSATPNTVINITITKISIIVSVKYIIGTFTIDIMTITCYLKCFRSFTKTKKAITGRNLFLSVITFRQK